MMIFGSLIAGKIITCLENNMEYFMESDVFNVI